MEKSNYQKFKIFIFTENADKLIKFYTDVLGLKIIKELKLEKDYVYMLEVAPGYEIWIANHSDVKGKSKEKYRYMINIYVESVKKAYELIKGKDEVEIIQEPICMNAFIPGEKRWVLTFTDPESNTIQTMGGE